MRYNIENVFIIGITPTTGKPSSDTIDNLLAPIVDEFLVLDLGVEIPTYREPNSTLVRVRIAPVLADTPARVLLCGFMTHAATHCCQFCTCTLDKIHRVNTANWKLRTGEEVRQQATKWKNAATITARTLAEKSNGVRWTSLHLLPYWDPVKHVMLGFMHNWLEGVLEEQLRSLWGIGRKTELEKLAEEERREERVEDLDEVYEESEIAESASEVEELLEEGSRHGNMFTQTRLRPRSRTPTPSTPEDVNIDVDMDEDRSSSGSLTSTIADALPAPVDEDNGLESDEDSGLESDDEFLDVPEHFNMPDNDLSMIRQSILKVTLPTWVGRPPANLGQASHGKLKANDFLVLFSFIFPLVMPELWQTETEVDQVHLKCFENLVICTNIVSSFKTSDADADLYTECYNSYRRSIRQLFPSYKQKPNHHYAMHNGDILKYWGPLPALSEFPGERLIGLLQCVNTNKKTGEKCIRTLCKKRLTAFQVIWTSLCCSR